MTRVLAAVHRIVSAHPGEDVLVVSHGGALNALWHHALRRADRALGELRGVPARLPGRRVPASRLSGLVEDYTNKYKGEQVEVALFGGEYQEGVLTAYCSIEDVPHIELNGHILVPLQNVASLHCSSRCDAPEPDWPPRGLTDDERDDEG